MNNLLIGEIILVGFSSILSQSVLPGPIAVSRGGRT